MSPARTLRLYQEAFGHTNVVCLGPHIAAVASVIDVVAPDLTWYVADVETLGPSPVARRQPAPEPIGDTAAFVTAASTVTQFESGVFAGVPRAKTPPCFREGGLWTEDPPSADLGDAVVELRAFDMTYVFVATSDETIAAHLASRFPLARRG